MSARDRSITLVLTTTALASWGWVALMFLTLSPAGNAGMQLLGAISLGVAVALTVWPLLWSWRRDVPGSIVSAGRRAGLAGLVISILVVLRALDAVSVPVVLFLVVGAVLVEAAYSLRR